MFENTKKNENKLASYDGRWPNVGPKINLICWVLIMAAAGALIHTNPVLAGLLIIGKVAQDRLEEEYMPDEIAEILFTPENITNIKRTYYSFLASCAIAFIVGGTFPTLGGMGVYLLIPGVLFIVDEYYRDYSAKLKWSTTITLACMIILILRLL